MFPAYYMKVFTDQGSQRSFRTTRARYRVQGALQPLKPILQKYAPQLFTSGKALVQKTLRYLERRGIVR